MFANFLIFEESYLAKLCLGAFNNAVHGTLTLPVILQMKPHGVKIYWKASEGNCFHKPIVSHYFDLSVFRLLNREPLGLQTQRNFLHFQSD